MLGCRYVKPSIVNTLNLGFFLYMLLCLFIACYYILQVSIGLYWCIVVY